MYQMTLNVHVLYLQRVHPGPRDEGHADFLASNYDCMGLTTWVNGRVDRYRQNLDNIEMSIR